LNPVSLNLLEPSGLVQACNGIALPLPLTDTERKSWSYVRSNRWMEERFSLVDIGTRRIIYLTCQGVTVNICKERKHEIQDGEQDTD
jgi:hypothetical protein